MFKGIDDVDWASMGHAYTDSATDVPELLWGLASDDPRERETALDGMYGAVHHQGDVYDSTVACVPFLFELIATERAADRAAVVELVGSVWRSVSPDDGPLWYDGDEEDEEEWRATVLRGRELIRDRAEVLLGLVTDPDDGLRAALPGALADLHPDPVRVFGVLRDRLPAEPSPAAARELVRAAGTLGTRHPRALGGAAGRLLGDVVAGSPDPRVRLAALAGLARCAPESLPADSVPIALDVMRLARETKIMEPPAPEPERPRTDTLLSHLRELEAEHRAAVDADVADDLLAELHRNLGDRTDLRYPLLVAQLRSPDRGQRLAAVSEAGRLMTGWRIPSDEPVEALGELLREPDLRLNRQVLGELYHLAPVSLPAHEALLDGLVRWKDEQLAPGERWWDLPAGKAINVLALQGRPDIVPSLVNLLSRSGLEVPEQLTYWIEALGPEDAAPLGPVLHERLAAPSAETTAGEHHRLVTALGLLGHRPSVPLVVDLVRSAPNDWVRRTVVRALVRYGALAAEAAPALRELLAADGPAPVPRHDVAAALWAVAG
ncbi:HEAT repeat domain-containing protein, partial [Streptomyces sp. CRN 30]|uniref:HEAT repeat domain-containing protein n=1 Tax=Streptomyces sp. CRN 30 TaxID=3075613 RepID=UPI002A80AEEB